MSAETIILVTFLEALTTVGQEELFMPIHRATLIIGTLGTPVLFDFGVFLVVIGIFLQILKKLGIKNS